MGKYSERSGSLDVNDESINLSPIQDQEEEILKKIFSLYLTKYEKKNIINEPLIDTALQNVNKMLSSDQDRNDDNIKQYNKNYKKFIKDKTLGIKNAEEANYKNSDTKYTFKKKRSFVQWLKRKKSETIDKNINMFNGDSLNSDSLNTGTTIKLPMYNEYGEKSKKIQHSYWGR